MKKIEADVRLTFPQSNRSPKRYASITVTDRASGLIVVDFELTAEQFTSVLASAGAVTQVDVQETLNYQNVGRKYVIKKVELPDDRFRYEREVTTEMDSFAVNEMVAAGFSGYRWTKHNYGWSLIINRYEEVEEA